MKIQASDFYTMEKKLDNMMVTQYYNTVVDNNDEIWILFRQVLMEIPI